MKTTHELDPSALLAAFESALALVVALPVAPAVYGEVNDSALIRVGKIAGEIRDSVAVSLALVAGEVARRSAPEHGRGGLAQRAGYRTPRELIKVTTGSTAREAMTAVRIGSLMVDIACEESIDSRTGEIAAVSESWLKAVTDAVAARRLSTAAAEAIRAGLGLPNPAVSAQQLANVALQLLAEPIAGDADRVFHRARELRNALDQAGVALDEHLRREQRSLRVFALPDGMGKVVWNLDPESFASVKDLYDRATSPKRGGVRFVSGERKVVADEIERDRRSPEQLGSDAFAELLRLGADADPRFLIGSGAPVVKVMVTRAALERRTGHARLEGQLAPVSLRSAERLACAGSTVEDTFDENGGALDVGREHRLYTKRQRVALAVRDGGCMAFDCDRPPSWCEAHHIKFWSRDGGKTDIADGILLCRHHHLLFHNNGWEISRDDKSRYWLIPPLDVSPERVPIPMPSKSAAMRDLEREPVLTA